TPPACKGVMAPRSTAIQHGNRRPDGPSSRHLPSLLGAHNQLSGRLETIVSLAGECGLLRGI
ncbi:MAG: hypothetical protein WCB53_16940, partial [Terriglobales bacterium]